MAQLTIYGEVVHVSREKVRFNKNRIFVTIADVKGTRHTVKLSKDQISEFDIEDHLQPGRKVYAELVTFEKGDKYLMPDKDGTKIDDNGRKCREETYKGDSRRLISMSALSSFELRNINATQSRDLLADVEEPDLQQSFATVLAGLK